MKTIKRDLSLVLACFMTACGGHADQANGAAQTANALNMAAASQNAAASASNATLAPVNASAQRGQDASIVVIPLAGTEDRTCSGGGGAIDDVLISASQYRALTDRLGDHAGSLRQLGIVYDPVRKLLAKEDIAYVPYFVATYPSGVIEIIATAEDFSAGLERAMPSEDAIVLIRLGGSSGKPKIIETGATRATFWTCGLKLKSASPQSYIIEASFHGLTQGTEFTGTSLIKIGAAGVLDLKTSRKEQ